MAEIKIEKKKTIWPWILLALLVVAALAWFILDDDDTDKDLAETEEVEQVEKVKTVASAETVATYESGEELITYIRKDEGKMGLDHVYTHGAFEKLIAAIREVAANNDYDISADLQKADQLSDKIKADPMSLKHANMIKTGFAITTTALENLKNAKYSDSDISVKDLKDISASLDVDKPTLDQKTAVKSYFDKSAEIIRKMNNKTKS